MRHLVSYICFTIMNDTNVKQMTKQMTNIQIGGKAVLKQDIINAIREDGILFGQVANSIGISPLSLPRLLIQNHWKLTLPNTLQVISERLDIKDTSSLLEQKS